MNPNLFWQPEIDGFTGIHATVYSFLISSSCGRHNIIFDLGVRPDWQNYAPKIVSLIKATTIVTPGSDVATVLDSDTSGLGIRSTDIEAVIWSHNHFDHIGDVSTFPSTTELVVGPGVKAISWPGWPLNPDADVLESDAKDRVVREVSFDSGLKIGRFSAHDFFGDGSFYLLDAPGHAVGHICGLARVSEESFVFMGADACHHLGVLRPSEYLPFPSSGEDALKNPLASSLASSYSPCPCESSEILQSYLADHRAPFFTIARGPLFPEYNEALDTVRKIQELDAANSVFVVMAHDLSLRDKIPLFPKTIDDWRTLRLKSKTRWAFCEDFLPALNRPS